MIAEDYAELEALREQYALGGLSMETPEGRRWKRRMEESEAYFRKYSKDWAANRALLCDFTKMLEDFGTYVAIAYPIISNFIADMYFRNPDPYIQDKGGDRDLGKILTDVARSIHAECDTESEFRACFLDQAWAGFGVMAGSFLQKPYNAGAPIMAQGEELGEDGQPQMYDTGEFVEPTEQKVLIQRISPWKCRFDPKGRRWDLSDHRYWAYDEIGYLGPLLRSLKSDDDRRRLMAFFSQGGAAFNSENGADTSPAGGVETDPEFIRVSLRAIWSRPDHMIYRMPYGASFTFEPEPWDEEWERADKYPIRYMPVNRVPENEDNTEGFIGMPWLTLIGQHVKNINKAQGLLLAGLEHVIDVYATLKGVLDDSAMERIAGPGRMFNVIKIDPKVLEKYPTAQDNPVNLKDLFFMLPTGDTKDMQHMAEIDHEFGLIAQIMGQGPADRGGISDSETATQSLGQQQGLARRMGANRNDAGKHYNAVTAIIFRLIQSRHTLSLRYQMTTSFNEKTWATFTDPRGALKDVDLHFDYATGSNEPQTREQVFAMRERAAAILMPIFQANQDQRNMLKLAEKLIEPLGILGMAGFFSDEATQIVMQLITILRGLGNGAIGEQEITADNAQVVMQIPELIAQLAKVILTPQQLAQVEAIVQGAQQPEGGGGGVGSIAKPPSPGEASAEAGAAGSAAAGMTGGLPGHQPMTEMPS